jgi:mono/diheme cytochrome c family protein/glucose/arabinose dehydrogenase
MFKQVYRLCLSVAVLLGSLCFIDFRKDDQDPSPHRSPIEEQATFQLEPGLQIQLVACEPMVQEPVVTTFDEDGRLWVVEMRGFMNSIDGAGENEKIGRISVLEDTTGDGRMDVSTIYLDSLVMPRAIALVPGGALVAENGSLWLTEDLNNDLKADTKTLIDSAYAGSPLPEHSGNGLWRGMDNCYYNAKSRFRYRLQNGKWERDSTEFRGQWGICHDDEGRLIYNYNWSQLHGDLVPPNYLSRNKNHKPTTGIDHGFTVDRRVYPIRSNPAVNRGYIPGTLDDKGRLLEFTAACSPLFYRGTALPQQYYGNVFVCEPSGNLIKRDVVEENGFLLSANDPHPGREFLASTDERFRPVQLSIGPDGALYIADMYRGVVQHAAYITPYLKDQSISRNLVQPVHSGRIWRIVPQGWKPPKAKKLSTASLQELVTFLSNPNGWQRDMAQRLLVERNDTTIGSALTSLALSGKNNLGRLQALWTLQGLQLLQPAMLFRLVADKNSLISNTAIRLLEPFALHDAAVREKLEAALLQARLTTSPKQGLQIALTCEALNPFVSNNLLAGTIERYGNFPLIRDAVMSSLGDREFAFMQYIWKAPQWQTSEPSREIFLEMLATAIIHKRDPVELTGLLAMMDVKGVQPGWRQKAVLTGLSMGGDNVSKPIRLKKAPTIFSKLAGKLEPGRQAALTALFEWPGQLKAKTTTARKSLLNIEEQKQFAAGRQNYLTTCAGCHGTDGAGMKRFAPPLIGSDWVLGDEKRLAMIVLHGMEGPVVVGGKKYDAPEILPVMPAHSTMDDGAITAILTYIRNEWGNNAGPVSRRTVSVTRNTTQGRVVPWKASELKKFVLETKTPESK